MTTKEKVHSILGIIGSAVFLICLYKYTYSHTFVPAIVFWIFAEILFFANAVSVYNLVMSAIERSRRTIPLRRTEGRLKRGRSAGISKSLS